MNMRCPYRTGDGKCTHKHPAAKKSKRKRFCGYESPSKCEMYCEWLEIRNSTEDEEKTIPMPRDSPSELNDTEGKSYGRTL